MKKMRVELVRSSIGHPKEQKATLKALKLTKMHKVVELDVTPQILGMINKVKHLVTVEEL
jgi:large subunit ribosomal protein L30